MTSPTSPRDDRAHIPQQPTAEPTGFATPPPARPARARWVWPAVAAVALVALLGGVGTWLALRPSMEDRAATACQELVVQRLKSPASAQWPEVRVESRGVDYFWVEGRVDSQNGFGALLRSSYTCELHTPDGGETWRNNGVKVS